MKTLEIVRGARTGSSLKQKAQVWLGLLKISRSYESCLKGRRQDLKQLWPWFPINPSLAKILDEGLGSANGGGSRLICFSALLGVSSNGFLKATDIAKKKRRGLKSLPPLLPLSSSPWFGHLHLHSNFLSRPRKNRSTFEFAKKNSVPPRLSEFRLETVGVVLRWNFFLSTPVLILKKS